MLATITMKCLPTVRMVGLIIRTSQTTPTMALRLNPAVQALIEVTGLRLTIKANSAKLPLENSTIVGLIQSTGIVMIIATRSPPEAIKIGGVG